MSEMSVPVYEWEMRKNPLTEAEFENIMDEAKIHRKIGKPEYDAMAEGMEDIAKQYKQNPKMGGLFLLGSRVYLKMDPSIKGTVVSGTSDPQGYFKGYIIEWDDGKWSEALGEDLEEIPGENPVKIRKLPGKERYRVKHDGTISAYATTKEKAEAQARFLRGLKHGMVPRAKNPVTLGLELGYRKRGKVPNPPLTQIYSRIITVYASKAGIPHRCDSKCRAAKHVYRHTFKRKAGIYGTSDGRLIVM